MTEFDPYLSLQNLFMLKFNSNFFASVNNIAQYYITAILTLRYFLKSVKSTTK